MSVWLISKIAPDPNWRSPTLFASEPEPKGSNGVCLIPDSDPAKQYVTSSIMMCVWERCDLMWTGKKRRDKRGEANTFIKSGE